jgi:hypothetical protein
MGEFRRSGAWGMIAVGLLRLLYLLLLQVLRLVVFLGRSCEGDPLQT